MDQIFNHYKEEVLNGNIDLVNDTIKLMLLTSSYTPDIDADEFKDDIDTNEVVGTGYTAGGQALAGKSVTQDNPNDRGYLDANDVNWAASTITARYMVLYKDTGVAGTSSLIAVWDFVTDKITSGGDFLVQWNASGVLELT